MRCVAAFLGEKGNSSVISHKYRTNVVATGLMESEYCFGCHNNMEDI